MREVNLSLLQRNKKISEDYVWFQYPYSSHRELLEILHVEGKGKAKTGFIKGKGNSKQSHQCYDARE